VMEVYFLGKPQVKYPWESRIGVVATPTPDVTETPEDQGEGDGNP
jgi:hypothetical protein